MERIKALRDARGILLAVRAAGGTGLNGVWEYLRDELDTARDEYDLAVAEMTAEVAR